MIVWIPYHDRGWHVISVDTEKTVAGKRLFDKWGKISVIYGSTIYCACYATEEEAWRHAHLQRPLPVPLKVEKGGIINGRIELDDIF